MRSYHFAKKLIKEGHKVHIVCLASKYSKTGLKGEFKGFLRNGFFQNIEITEINIPYSNYLNLVKRSFVFLTFAFYASQITLKSDSDIVLASSTPLTIAIPALLNKWVKGIPFIFEIRDLWPELPKAMGLIKNPILLKLLNSLEKTSYKFASHCIGLAPGICAGIEAKDIHKSRISLIPNFCDLDSFHPSKYEKKSRTLLNAYSNNKFTSDDLILVFAGAHGLANGLNFIINVCEFLQKKNYKKIHIFLIGDGSQKPNLLNLAKKKGLKNCHFLDTIAKKELAKILNEEVDIGLMILSDVKAFYNGTSPNKFFDYIASGLPILINYPGWIAKIICDKNIGVFSEPGNVSGFANEIINLFNDKDKLKFFGKNSRKLAEESFSKECMSQKLYLLVEKIYFLHKKNKKNFLNDLIYRITKSFSDKLLALILIIVSLPILVLFYFLIYFNLGNPVIFRQKRPGLNGSLFTNYKFRTMRELFDEKGNYLSDNQRITKLGSFIRSTSIDEIPQLFNIIKGDISFVGPRPLLVEYLNLYNDEQNKRHNILPGLTGWAQINGRNTISWDKKFKFDLWYLEHRNIFVDINILFRTFFKVLIRTGINSSDSKTMERFIGSKKK